MAFRFTQQDFERYVKQEEHGGQHIWHELQDRLQVWYGVPFNAAPYIARGDRLRTIWFSPRGTPRSVWANQAQPYLSRDIEKAQLEFGLMIECTPPMKVAQYGQDPDQDGRRLIDALKHDPEFVTA